MKKLLFLFSIISIFSCSNTDLTEDLSNKSTEKNAARQSNADVANWDQKSLFNINEVPSITLQFSEIQWNKILTNFDLNPKNEKKVIAAFTYALRGNSIQLDSIGLKLKGNTSRRRPEGETGQNHSTTNPDWHHCHFSLDFSKYRDNQRFLGRNKVALKWFKDDAAYAREIYSYDLFRRFGIWTAPRASYCRVFIKVDNTELADYGVYALIESVDEDFIAKRGRHWGTAVGDMWKGGHDTSGNSANFVQTASMGIEDVTLNPNTSVYYAYDLKTNEANLASAKINLIQFINDLNSKTGTDFKNWISTKMDVPLFLRTYATNVILGMWDDYWNNANNFYFYFAANGRAYFIPYDYDNTLGTSLLLNNSGTQNPLNWGQSNRPLITKVLAIPEYQQLYKNAISELINSDNNLFHSSRSIPRIQAWQAKINGFVVNDTGEDMSIMDQPAYWGNQPNYRLLSGNSQGGNNGAGNYFTSRTASIPW